MQLIFVFIFVFKNFSPIGKGFAKIAYLKFKMSVIFFFKNLNGEKIIGGEIILWFSWAESLNQWVEIIMFHCWAETLTTTGEILNCTNLI